MNTIRWLTEAALDCIHKSIYLNLWILHMNSTTPVMLPITLSSIIQLYIKVIYTKHERFPPLSHLLISTDEFLHQHKSLRFCSVPSVTSNTQWTWKIHHFPLFSSIIFFHDGHALRPLTSVMHDKHKLFTNSFKWNWQAFINTIRWLAGAALDCEHKSSHFNLWILHTNSTTPVMLSIILGSIIQLYIKSIIQSEKDFHLFLTYLYPAM